MNARPSAFKLPSAKSQPLFLFFGKGDYVIARSLNEAACLWADHFDDLAYAREFQQIPNNEHVEIWVSDTSTTTIATQAMANDRHSQKLKMNAAWWIKRFGIGYLASTTED